MFDTFRNNRFTAAILPSVSTQLIAERQELCYIHLPFAAFLNLTDGVSLMMAALGKSKKEQNGTVFSW